MGEASDCNELGLHLRHWLILQTYKKLYGLEWVNNKTCIKVLWVDQHHENWEKCYELYEAWAKHRSLNVGPTDFIRLKSIFRNAMHRSKDFEEIVSENNIRKKHKIYKLLTRKEIETRKPKFHLYLRHHLENNTYAGLEYLKPNSQCF